MQDRLFEAVTRNKQVQANGRRQVAEFHGREKHNAEMHRVHIETGGDWQDQRHNQHNGRKNIKNRAQHQQEQ